MTLQERYLQDRRFADLVDMICTWIDVSPYAPTDVRDAASLAATHQLQRVSTGSFITNKEVK